MSTPRSKPTVLLAATDRWYPTARLGMALAETGCTVDAVCPSGHPLRLTHATRQIHRYNGLVPLYSFSRAIRKTNPDLVIPADDLATRHLHDLYRQQSLRGIAGREICDLIERSLGPATSFDVVTARNAFMRLAAEEEVRVPHSEVIASISTLHDWIARMGFPIVLKANGTSGGDGVRIINTIERAEQALRKLQAPPLLARAAKHAVIDRDFTLLRPSLSRCRPVISAQSFVAGREATSTFFCWQGKVLASLHFEVLQKIDATRHATVIRRTEHAEMSDAAEKISRRLNLSGFYGLDFMIESKTGHAYLIEINPRTTQVGHLALGKGQDLPAALYAALTATVLPAGPCVTENDTIALFPQEWKRDPASPFLMTAYHDVPWQAPAMVSACAIAVQKQDINRGRKAVEVDAASDRTKPQMPATAKTKSGQVLAQQNEI